MSDHRHFVTCHECGVPWEFGKPGHEPFECIGNLQAKIATLHSLASSSDGRQLTDPERLDEIVTVLEGRS